MSRMLVSLRWLAAAAYRLGAGPRPSDVPDAQLARLVEGGAAGGRPPGRALDLGCAAGRNAVYLARHGWQVTGVDLAAGALAQAQRRAADAGVALRLVRGDVSRLGELGVGGGYRLLVDAGCYHLVPVARRDGYVAGVTAAAAPGADLLLVGFGHWRFTVDEVRARFTGWRLVDGPVPVPAGELLGYVAGPAVARAVIRRGWLSAVRFHLARV